MIWILLYFALAIVSWPVIAWLWIRDWRTWGFGPWDNDDTEFCVVLSTACAILWPMGLPMAAGFAWFNVRSHKRTSWLTTVFRHWSRT